MIDIDNHPYQFLVVILRMLIILAQQSFYFHLGFFDMHDLVIVNNVALELDELQLSKGLVDSLLKLFIIILWYTYCQIILFV